MQVDYSLDRRLTDRPAILTIGKFDGVHLGHQALIRTTVERAQELGFASAVLTWEPHPKVVLNPDQTLQLLTSLEDRIELIAEIGPDILIIAPFTRETMQSSADAYMRQICQALPLRELWVGEDFAMGRKREGNIPRLMEIGAELGFAIGTVTSTLESDAPISASRVRQLLHAGAVESAILLLGRPFSLKGVVVHGHQRGRTIGFPTANLHIGPKRLVPADGVYACRAYIQGTIVPAVTNVGLRPTFNGVHRVIEAYLLDWERDIYGAELRLEFLHRLRGEQKFATVDELAAQIVRDVAHTRQLLHDA